MNSSPRPAALRLRIALALLLMVLFYLLALGIAAALLSIPYWEWTTLHRVDLKLALFGLLGGGVVLYSIIPRRETFQAPGPQVTPATQPQLFRELRRVASATGQRMPDEVYLLPDVNAWVADYGRRRILAIGLPLMHLLTVSQFRAVLAHEFGHYSGGDTRLGAWIYRVRKSMARTVHELNEFGHILRHPFRWYTLGFLKLTYAISRAQEFEADRVAARVTSPQALMDGLQRVHSGGPAFAHYWQTETVPVLRSGYRAPLGLGFMHYLQTPDVAQWLETHQERAQAASSDPFDTHPTLTERLRAAARLPKRSAPDTDPPADTLLQDTESAEHALLQFLMEHRQELQPVEWADIGTQVWAPQWRERREHLREHLRGLTARDLPELARNPHTWTARRQRLAERGMDDNQTQASAWAAIGAALADAGVRAGFHVHALPGEAITLERGTDRFEPFQLTGGLAHGHVTPEAFVDALNRVGLADVDLGDTGA
ncbi:M48 family metallopeptidase [Deinococcus maricopensis]|nr:M48 family metallopeptidase [Deinococcus maricopensis]